MRFMDIPLLPLRYQIPVAQWSDTLSIEPQRMWHITTELLRAFFDRHVLDRDGWPPLGSRHPEVVLGPPADVHDDSDECVAQP